MITKNSKFYRRRHSAPQKVLASLVILAFFFSQTVPAGYADITLRPDERVVPYVPETDALENSPNSQQNQTPGVPKDPYASFQQNSALSKDNTATPDQHSVYDADERSFEDAVDQLNLDYASAVVVESLTAQNLRDLNKLDVEVGIAVIRGKIVMFTTGSRDELRANPVVQALLAESSILIHTHPQGTQTTPSALDINLAGTANEYLLSSNGVTAYNANGIVSSSLTEEDLVQLLETSHVYETSSAEARAVLNTFIANIDEYNTNPEQYGIYRSAQPISVLPGRPALGTWSYNGNSDPVVSQVSTSEFSATYNVSASGSYSGVTINFATNGQTSQDLSGLGYFSFDVKSSVACSASTRCLKVELKDTAGHVAAFGLPSLSTTYGNIAVETSWIQWINPSLDLGHIKEINFVFENSQTPVKAATVGIKIGGLSYTPVISATTANALTNLGGAVISEMEPCKVALVNGSCPSGQNANTVTNFSQTNTGAANFSYNLANGTGNNRWAGSLISFPGNFDLTTQNLVFAASDAGSSYYKLELIDAQNDKVTLRVNVDGRIEVTNALVQTAGVTAFDADQIKYVALVVDAPATTGTVTISTTGLSYTPVINGDSYNASLLTNLPGYPSLGTSTGAANGGVANGTINQIQTSANAFNFAYTLVDNDDFVYSQMGWGYFQNPGVQRISRINYVPGVGFRLTITDPVGVDSYNIQYSDDYGQTWKTAQGNVAVSGTGTTTWLDDGSLTDPDPLDVNVRWYRATVAQSHQVFQGTPQNFSAGLTLAVNGPSGQQLKVEVLDQNGKKAIFYLNLTGSFQNYTLNLTGDNIPAGFDNTHVTLVNFVADKGHMGSSGTVYVVTQGLHYTETIDGNPSLNASNISHLTGVQQLGSFGSSTPSATGVLSQTSSTQFSVAYDVTNANSYAGSFTSFDNSETSGVETRDLSTLGNIVLGLSLLSGTGDIVLELKDSHGKMDSVILHGVTTAEQFFQIALTNFKEVDLTSIISLNLVILNANVTAKSGTLSARFGDLPFLPVVVGTPYVVGNITTLPGSPVVSANHGTTGGGDDDATITTTQASNTTFSNVSNVPDSGDFTFSTIGWGYFSNPTTFVGTAANLGNTVTLALNGTVAGRVLKVEFVSSADSSVKKVFLVTLAVGQQNFTFDITGLGTVGMINFVQDQTGATSYTVETKGLKIVPIVPNVSPTPGLTSGDISHLTGLLNLVAFNSQAPDPTATVTTSPLSATQFNVNYNVTNGASYGGSISTFDNFSTTPKEYVDLSALTQITLGLRLQSGTGSVEFVVEDSTGAKAKVLLTGVGTTEQFYRVNTTLLTGINWSKISNIVVVVANANVTQKIGVLEVRFGNNYYVPYITGTAYNEANLTSFGTLPTLGSGSGNTVSGQPLPSIQLVQNSSTEFGYQYDLSSSSTGFTFVSIARSDYYQLLPTAQYIFAASGTDGARIKVEIKDTDGDVASFIVLLTPTLQNFTLDLPSNINRLRIREIVFVQDRNLGSPLLNDFVNIKTKGPVRYEPNIPGALSEIQTTLTTRGLDYFETGAGLDPVTHFPYDNITNGTTGMYTQPTLIGFYLQILGDMVRGSVPLNNGWTTKTQALTEIQTVLTNLLSAQSTYGWDAPGGAVTRGLIPWLDLGPGGVTGAHENKVAFIDNANLAQSLAVTVGALESTTGLTPAELAMVTSITNNVDLFLNNQAPGYAAFVDSATGLFRGDYAWNTDPSTGTYQSYIDRLATESRGAIAFLLARFPTLPRTVWDNLEIKINDYYVARDGQNITNLAEWNGAAFPIFWPSLRNDEMDFIGFRNAIYNQLVTQLDYSYQNRIPGVLSASGRPEGGYFGNSGIPQIAEANVDPNSTNSILGDIGSTYALAAAMNVDIYAVLGWLDSIDNLYGMNGIYGFLDGARSASEIAQSYVGIDVASTILGLKGTGGSDFQTYLRNRSLESYYNALYDEKSRLLVNITRTTTALPNAPEFPDRSLAVFSNIDSEGAINNLHSVPPPTTPPTPIDVTLASGIRFAYTNLAGADSGHFWKLDQVYNAQANQFILNYSAVDSPQRVRVELKDAAGIVLYQTTATLQQGVEFARIVIDLPNLAALANVKEVDLVVDPQEGGDATGDFVIHAINFQHVPSAPAASFTALAGSQTATTLPANDAAIPVPGVGQLASSSSNSTLQHAAGTRFFQLHFDLTAANAYAQLVLNFDPNGDGSSADLSAVPNLIFGINSAVAKNLKIEFKDVHGNTYSTSNTDIVAAGYYKFLTSLAAARVDLSQIKSITFGVDQYSVTSGAQTGDLTVEIGGLA